MLKNIIFVLFVVKILTISLFEHSEETHSDNCPPVITQENYVCQVIYHHKNRVRLRLYF